MNFQSTLEIRDNLYFFQYCVNRSKMSPQHKKLIDYYTSIPLYSDFFQNNKRIYPHCKISIVSLVVMAVNIVLRYNCIGIQQSENHVIHEYKHQLHLIRDVLITISLVVFILCLRFSALSKEEQRCHVINEETGRKQILYDTRINIHLEE